MPTRLPALGIPSKFLAGARSHEIRLVDRRLPDPPPCPPTPRAPPAGAREAVACRHLGHNTIGARATGGRRVAARRVDGIEVAQVESCSYKRNSRERSYGALREEHAAPCRSRVPSVDCGLTGVTRHYALVRAPSRAGPSGPDRGPRSADRGDPAAAEIF